MDRVGKLKEMANRIENLRNNIEQYGIPEDKREELEDLVSQLEQKINELKSTYE